MGFKRCFSKTTKLLTASPVFCNNVFIICALFNGNIISYLTYLTYQPYLSHITTFSQAGTPLQIASLSVSFFRTHPSTSGLARTTRSATILPNTTSPHGFRCVVSAAEPVPS